MTSPVIQADSSDVMNNAMGGDLRDAPERRFFSQNVGGTTLKGPRGYLTIGSRTFSGKTLGCWKDVSYRRQSRHRLEIVSFLVSRVDLGPRARRSFKGRRDTKSCWPEAASQSFAGPTSDADAAGPKEVVKSESTSDNLEKKGETSHAISITDL